jgi:hypothetical protein
LLSAIHFQSFNHAFRCKYIPTDPCFACKLFVCLPESYQTTFGQALQQIESDGDLCAADLVGRNELLEHHGWAEVEGWYRYS